MALHRGIQSAIFYYISCVPCLEAGHRRKRRKETELLNAEKLSVQATRSDTYRYKHPTQTNTNPAWDLEIAMGPNREPSLPVVKGKGKVKVKREVHEIQEEKPGSRGSGTTKSRLKVDTEAHYQERMAWASTFQRDFPEDSTISPKTPAGSFQPTDDLLAKDKSQMKTTEQNKSTKIGRPSVARQLSNRTRDDYTSSHPPINELHPPVVMQYKSPKDVSWMMQAPPTAYLGSQLRTTTTKDHALSPHSVNGSAASSRDQSNDFDRRSSTRSKTSNNDVIQEPRPSFSKNQRDIHSLSPLDYDQTMVELEKRDSLGFATAILTEKPHDSMDPDSADSSQLYNDVDDDSGHSSDGSRMEHKTRKARLPQRRWSIDF